MHAHCTMPRWNGARDVWRFLFCATLLMTAGNRVVYADEADELVQTQKQIRDLEAKGNAREAILQAQQTLPKAEKFYADHPEKVSPFLDLLANLYKRQGRYSDAEPLYKRSLELREKALGPDHSDVAESLNNLAILYDKQNRYPEAETLYQRSLKVFEKALGPNHASVATSLSNLANLYARLLRYADAEPLYKRSLAIREKVQKPDHPQFATLLNSLADLYKQQGRYSEAEPLYKRSLELREKVLGLDHSDVAEALYNLALLYDKQNRYSEAEPLYERSIKVYETALGPDHPRLATSLNNQATLYAKQLRYADAEPLYKRSLAIREKALGPDHPSVAASLSSIASVYVEQLRYTEAEPLYLRSLAIREKAMKPDHPDIATCLGQLAFLYQQQGRLLEAEPLFTRSLALREKALQPDHTDIASSLNNLALLYRQQGRFSEAEPLYQRSIKVYEKAVRPDQLKFASAINNLAYLYQSQSRHAEAEPLYNRSLMLIEKTLGPDHPKFAASLNNIAHLYQSQGRLLEAEPLYKRSLALREKALGQEHPDVANSLGNLAALYRQQGRYAEAEPLFHRAMTIQEKVLGSDHPDVATSLYGLARLYSEQKRYLEAEPLIDRAISIYDRAGVSPGARYRSYLLRSRIAWNLQEHASAFTDLRKAMDFAEIQRSHSAGTEHERAGFFSSMQEAFEQMIAWQLEQRETADYGEVVAAIERSRARSLLDDLSLAAVNLDVGRTAAEREQLRQQESELNSRVAQLEKQYETAKTEAERNRLRPQLAEAREAVYQQYREQRASNPVYRNLLSAAAGPPRLRQFQRTLTTDNTLLLVYYLGMKAGYVVAIQSDQVRLSAISVNEEAAKPLGCDAGPLTSKRMQAILMNDKKTGVLQKLADTALAETVTTQLAALWQVLIPEQFRVQIQSGQLKQLIIVPDASLSSLPFEALVVNSGDTSTYLIDVGLPIQYAPSMTVLFNLRERLVSKVDPKIQPVLTVGNPLYGNAAAASDDSLAMLSAGTRYAERGGHLQQLPFSGTESDWVYDSFTKSGINVDRLLQRDATEANVRSQVPGRRVIHLACHGLVDQEHGNFFGSLAVTPGPKGNDDPADDGFLTLAEIYRLDLKNCELAILSACETNFGPQQQGEGTWALSRGFIVAGARRVVASNWLVDDEAAASLVSYFCGGLARDEKQGKTPDYAQRLHAAKLWVRQQDKWSSPYYWAPFILMGPN